MAVIDLDACYVYDGTEVRCTGRTANKPSTINGKVTLTLYEIKPSDPETVSFRKWVKLTELYTITPDCSL